MSVKQTHVKQNTGTMQTAAEISARAHEILHRYWGYDSFRPCQLDIITSVMQGHDTLGLMPTGGGKSLTFQVPAMILEGLTVVVTPLISLMKDQVDALKDRDIRAGALYSGQTPREARLVYDRARLGILRLLYVSPERLGTETFRQHLQAFDIRLIVVDEAHCISQWGYDFRPSYLKIAELRTLVPDVPILALTASATPQVRRDIMARLNFGSDAAEYTLSFARPNISFVVRHIEDKDAKLFDVLDHTSGTAIVYVRSRRRTGQIAQMLCERGISAAAYHAGMDADEKARRQELWKSSKIRVIVATNAFGMGIDKADVRTVIHYDLPSSLEEYYQEDTSPASEPMDRLLAFDPFVEFDDAYELVLSLKEGKPWYVPPIEELEKYEDELYIEKNKAFDSVIGFLKDEFKLDFIDSNSKIYNAFFTLKLEDHNFDNFLDELQQSGLDLTFERVQKLAPYYTELNNNTRMQANNGYTPAETEKLREEFGFSGDSLYISELHLSVSHEHERHKKMDKQINEFRTMRTMLSQYDLANDLLLKTQKPGRNDPCPCGSGKKYKKCCGRSKKD